MLQFGVKSKGVKYDAVLKTVKVTSPFVGELKEGDRLVAIDGRRVSEANKYGVLASCESSPHVSVMLGADRLSTLLTNVLQPRFL